MLQRPSPSSPAEDPDTEVLDASQLVPIGREDIDVQIATAKRYPRSIQKFVKTALSMATLNVDTAASCIYSLPRGNKPIKGPSIRLAEILLGAYTNIRAAGRPISEENGFVVCEGACLDVEHNAFIAVRTRRKITDKDGRRYSDDMITVTSNAGTSIALRNAILHIIPKAFWEPIYQAAVKTAVGDQKTLGERRTKALEFFSKLGIPPARVFARFAIVGEQDITLEILEDLLGLASAIREESISVDEAFRDDAPAATGKPKEQDIATAIQEALDAVTQDPDVQQIIMPKFMAIKATPAQQLVDLRAFKGKPMELIDKLKGQVTKQPEPASDAGQTSADAARVAAPWNEAAPASSASPRPAADANRKTGQGRFKI